jgi:hypothetical protein
MAILCETGGKSDAGVVIVSSDFLVVEYESRGWE